jgi:tRNA (guanine37-N1)-methyltransferase
MSEPWQAVVLTLFPEMFPGPLGHSLAGKGLAAGVWVLDALDIRAHAGDRYRSVDDTPFGGGSGMVLRPDVVDATIRAASERFPALPLIHLTPRGERLTQPRVRALAAGPGAILLCGHYEGIDERVLEAWQPTEIAIGDFVLSGGETAAFAVIDACVRLLPGIVGNAASLSEESFENGLLEYPQYTRPRIWAGRSVPEVLLSGHHGRIAAWRGREAARITRERRPDLWYRYHAAGGDGFFPTTQHAETEGETP